MSDFAYQPTPGAAQAREPRVNRADFGGLERRIEDGINYDLPSWDLAFVLPEADALAAEAFFEARGGTVSFTWTPSGEAEGRFVCEAWDRTRTNVGVHTILTTFRRVLS